jgi:hypothetical protein
MIKQLRPKELKPLFKWSKDGVLLLLPYNSINLEKIEHDNALDILDNLLEQDITKYQRQDIKEVINYLTEKN